MIDADLNRPVRSICGYPLKNMVLSPEYGKESNEFVVATIPMVAPIILRCGGKNGLRVQNRPRSYGIESEK